MYYDSEEKAIGNLYLELLIIAGGREYKHLKKKIMGFWTIAIIAGTLQSKSNAKKANERAEGLTQALSKEDSFVPTKKIIGYGGHYIFAVDDKNEKLLIIRGTSKKIIDYGSIISYEIIENNTLISKKSTMRTVGGAALGGLVAGGAGLIVGGLSGGTKESKKVSSLRVKLLLKDISSPSYEIECFNSSVMSIEGKQSIDINKMEGFVYQACLKHATQIADTLGVIIDRIDSREVSSSTKQTVTQTPTHSLAGELEKLFELKEKGILTEDEYSIQKAKLLE